VYKDFWENDSSLNFSVHKVLRSPNKNECGEIMAIVYGKAKMPSSKFIAKEFVLDIVAKKLQKPISLGNICRRNQHQPML
jgi:hypothetical protein